VPIVSYYYFKCGSISRSNSYHKAERQDETPWPPTVYGRIAMASIAETKQEAAVEIAFNVIVERDEEGFYVATVPELSGCHTQARSLDTLLERIKEAIGLCLEEQGPPASSTQ
jgi:predicted RNase H-like HicB family nuclease